MQFRNDIQGLRAIAFLLVFFFHLNKQWLPGGFLGVDLFFVISGFLMTIITLGDIEKGRFTFTSFFLKRIKRILPAYYVLLVTVAFFGAYLWLFSDMLTLKKTILHSMLFESNRQFADGGNYFGATLSENPLLHTWSLSIEMQFYIILPFVIYFCRKHLVKVFLAIIIVLTVYASYEIYFQHQHTRMYFSLPSRIPEFLVGGLYALVFKNGVNLKRRNNNILAFASLTILLVSSVLISETSNFPGILALVPCIAGANLLVVKNNALSDFLSSKTPVYIGELSYSLYLWHFPVMAFLRYKNDSYGFNFSEILFIVATTFALAWLSYYFVENRFRKISDAGFFRTFIPTALVVAIFSFFLPRITENKRIPDIFEQTMVGTKSHNTNSPEKLGDVNRNDSILLIGDSHAQAIKPFLDYIGKKEHFSFQTLTCSRYPAIEGIKESEIPKDDYNLYKGSTKSVALTKKLIENSKIVILNSLSFVRDEKNNKNLDEEKGNIPSLQTAVEKLVTGLRKDQKIVLINTFPILEKNPLKTNNGFIKSSNYQFQKTCLNVKNKDYIESLSKKYKNVYVYDLSKSKIFQTAPYINDTVAYYNKTHINTFASLRMAEDLENDFMAFLQANRISIASSPTNHLFP